MYIANKTFTSKHGHNYTKDQRITNARYLFLALEDKFNFDYYPHGSFRHEEEENPNFTLQPHEYYYESDTPGFLVGAVAAEELMNTSPAIVVDEAPTVDPLPIDQPFGGGDGGGGGATDSWAPDPTPDPDPVSYDSTPDTSYDSSPSSDNN
jgi:hypothetical protein